VVVVVVGAGAVVVVVGGRVVVVVGGTVVVVVAAVEEVVDDEGRAGAARRVGRDVQAPAPIAAAPNRSCSIRRRVSSGLSSNEAPHFRVTARFGQAVAMVRAIDERNHAPGFDELWAESWHLDFSRMDGLGGFVGLCLFPNLNVAWWWTHLLTAEGLVAVRDHEVTPPRTGLEIRAEGLWGELVCETPLEHWSFGLEAFGVRYDDPAEAWGAEWGERVPVGLDLEWELLTPPVEALLPGPPGPPDGGYLQAGTVRGELLVGDGRIPVDGTGLRSRRWGKADWWDGSARSWAGLIDGAGAISVRQDLGSGDVEVLGTAPVLVTGPAGRRARLERVLCRSGDSRGWGERLLPASPH
jgi:hypothetical protein